MNRITPFQWVFVVLALLLCCYFTWSGQQFLVHNVYNDADSSYFIYGGQVVAKGGVLYRDFWDQKPPAIFYQNAFLIKAFGLNMGAWAWVHALAFLSSLLFGAMLLKDVLGKTMLWFWVVVVSFGFNLNNYLDMGNRTEFGLALFEMLAMTWVVGAFKWKGRFAQGNGLFWAGFCAAIASMYKPVGMASLLATIALWGFHMLWGKFVKKDPLKVGFVDDERAESISVFTGMNFVAAMVGFISGLALFLVPVASEGQLFEVWRATFAVPLSLTGGTGKSLWQAIVDYPIKLGPLWGWLWPMSLGLILLFIRSISVCHRYMVAWLLLWNAATFCGIVLMRHGHPHYYHPAVVPCLTLSFVSAAVFLNVVLTKTSLLTVYKRGIRFGFLLLLTFSGVVFSRYFVMRQYGQVESLAATRFEQYAPYRKVADYLSSALQSDQTFFYWSMGYSPYIHADRSCPGVVSPSILTLGDVGAQLVMDDLKRVGQRDDVLFLLENPETFPQQITKSESFPEGSKMRAAVLSYLNWRDTNYRLVAAPELAPFKIYEKK